MDQVRGTREMIDAPQICHELLRGEAGALFHKAGDNGWRKPVMLWLLWKEIETLFGPVWSSVAQLENRHSQLYCRRHREGGGILQGLIHTQCGTQGHRSICFPATAETIIDGLLFSEQKSYGIEIILKP